jgi:hypothetical protein
MKIELLAELIQMLGYRAGLTEVIPSLASYLDEGK